MDHLDTFEMYADIDAERYEERDFRYPDRYDAIAAKYDEISDGLLDIIDRMTRRAAANRAFTPSLIALS